MTVVGIIPARLAATRLPDKPLLDIAGKTMIQRVWERAREAVCLDEVLIATPDERIREAVEAFGGRVVMTSDRHRSGTDRLAEAAENLDAEIIVNIQGDLPFVNHALLAPLVGTMCSEASIQMATLAVPLHEIGRAHV